MFKRNIAAVQDLAASEYDKSISMVIEQINGGKA